MASSSPSHLSTSSSALDVLPIELQFVIFTYISPHQLLQLSTVCKSWNALCLHNFLWKNLAYRYFGSSFTTHTFSTLKNQQQQNSTKKSHKLQLLESESIAPLTPTTTHGILTPSSTAAAASNNTNMNIFEEESKRQRIWLHTFQRLHERSNSPILIRYAAVDYMTGKVIAEYGRNNNYSNNGGGSSSGSGTTTVRPLCISSLKFPLREQGVYNIDGYLDVDTYQNKGIYRKNRGIKFASGEMSFTECDGTLKWSRHLGPRLINCINIYNYETPRTTLEQQAHIGAAASAADKYYDMLLMAVDNGVMAIDRNTGEELWFDDEVPNFRLHLCISTASLMAVDQPNERMCVWDVVTGKKKWTLDFARVYGALGKPIVVGGGCYVLVTEDQRSIVIDHNGNVILDSQQVPEVIKAVHPIVGGGGEETGSSSSNNKVLFVSDHKMFLLDLNKKKKQSSQQQPRHQLSAVVADYEEQMCWSMRLGPEFAFHHRFKIIPIPSNAFTFDHYDLMQGQQHVLVISYSIVYKKSKDVNVMRVNVESGEVIWNKQGVPIQDETEMNLFETPPRLTCKVFAEIRRNYVCIVSQLTTSNRVSVLNIKSGSLLRQHKFNKLGRQDIP